MELTELSADFRKNLNYLAGMRFSEDNIKCVQNGKKCCFSLQSHKVLDNLLFLSDSQKISIFDLCSTENLNLIDFLQDKYYECDWWDDGHGNYYHVPCGITGEWPVYFGLMDENGCIHT